MSSETSDLRPSEFSRDAGLSLRAMRAGYRGQYVVDDISLDLRPGEMVGLVGHNGSGKSTVLLGIAGLIEHTCAALRIDGRDLTGTMPRKRIDAGLGILLQRGAVFPNLTIDNNLKIAGMQSRQTDLFERHGEAVGIVQEILKRTQVPAGSLSGGERRILGLLMILGRNPRYFLVDEPTLGLSDELERQIFSILDAYVTHRHAAVLLVSHNLRLVERECTRTYIVQEGRIEREVMQEAAEESLESYLQMS